MTRREAVSSAIRWAASCSWLTHRFLPQRMTRIYRAHPRIPRSRAEPVTERPFSEAGWAARERSERLSRNHLQPVARTRPRSPWFRHGPLTDARRPAQPTPTPQSRLSRDARNERPESKPPAPGKHTRSQVTQTPPPWFQYDPLTDARGPVQAASRTCGVGEWVVLAPPRM